MVTINSKTLYDEVNLDTIISQLMDKLSVTTDSSFKERESAIMDNARSYAKTIMQRTNNKVLSDEEVTTIVEENIGELIDSINESNQTYLEAGIRIGANLLLQLLGYTQTECVQNIITK